jgi:hypothetical protein
MSKLDAQSIHIERLTSNVEQLTATVQDQSELIQQLQARQTMNLLQSQNLQHQSNLAHPVAIQNPGIAQTHRSFLNEIPAVVEHANEDSPEILNITSLAFELRRVLGSWLEQRKIALLYKATRDGFSASTFHSKCNKKGPTLIIIWSQGYIFGGYASQSWSSVCTRTVLMHCAHSHTGLSCCSGAR